jgi:hypothetical protein
MWNGGYREGARARASHHLLIVRFRVERDRKKRFKKCSQYKRVPLLETTTSFLFYVIFLHE